MTQLLTDGLTDDLSGVQPQNNTDLATLKQILEAAIFASDQVVSLKYLRQTLFDVPPSQAMALEAINALMLDYQNKGIQLQEVAGGYRFITAQNVSPWVSRLWEEKPERYSRAVLETLAIIVYRQPVTRGEIEAIRGVAVSQNVLKTLLDRDWVQSLGQKEVPGRPMMYGSTANFLQDFQLSSLADLPPLSVILNDSEALAQMMTGVAEIAVIETPENNPVTDGQLAQDNA
jgi:segregation and condensation protein B